MSLKILFKILIQSQFFSNGQNLFKFLIFFPNISLYIFKSIIVQYLLPYRQQLIPIVFSHHFHAASLRLTKQQFTRRQSSNRAHRRQIATKVNNTFAHRQSYSYALFEPREKNRVERNAVEDITRYRTIYDWLKSMFISSLLSISFDIFRYISIYFDISSSAKIHSRLLTIA